MIPRVGQKIGPYEILGRLGSGGMGLVFSAWDARLHRDVAIKLLKDEFLNSTMRSRFLGEARAASRLNHPNICTIFDIGEEQDCPYMVMELLKGETLRGRMQQGPMPVVDILQVGTQVADALSVAHEQGIVHRDVKPANVVLVSKPSGGFQTKVLDFGLAKVDFGEDSHSGLTTTGMTVGTVSYMSPEQARGELLDGRSDIFSLGVLMYEMTSGKLPFDGATSALIFVQLLNHPPEPLRNLSTPIPRALEQVINRCLQKDPNQRYQTAQDLVAALHKAAQNLSSSEKTASWFSKFANGLTRETSSPSDADDTEVEVHSEAKPLQISSEEAFLKPFRPQRAGESSSLRYRPVNAAYDASEQDRLPDAPQEESPAADDDDVVTPIAPQPTSAPRIPAYARPEGADENTSKLNAIAWLNEPVEAPPHDELPSEPEEHLWSGTRILLGLLLAVGIVIITIAVVVVKKQAAASHFAPTTIVAAVSNHTGDNALADLVAVGLELSVEQSPFVGVRRIEAGHPAVIKEVPRLGDATFVSLQQLAKASGAATFVVTDVHMEGSAYKLFLQLYDTNRGTQIGHSMGTAVGRDQLLSAIDSLSIDLRSMLGEGRESIRGMSAPLAKGASANTDALLSFRLGQQLEAQGHYLDAMTAFEHASELDSHFAQPQLSLARLCSHQRAEVSAADAANQARATASNQRLSLLATGSQNLLTTGDLDKAESVFYEAAKTFPQDPDGFSYLSEVQRAKGEFDAALKSAQMAVSLAPSDQTALQEQTLSLLALNRTEASAQIAPNQARSARVVRAPDLLVHFLSSSADASMIDPAGVSDDFGVEITQAQILDASGRMGEGLSRWRAIAQKAAVTPELVSAASYALSQASLDRALVGDCATATSLEGETTKYPTGPAATFALGMTSGLCGDLGDVRAKLAALSANYPQSFRVKGFYSSDLNALSQWKSGALADAVATLQSADRYDAISFNSYLLGQVYVAQKQPQPATVAFQTGLRRGGALVSISPEAFTATYLSLARAFVANGDVNNASQTYSKLAGILRYADPTDPLLIEARLATQH